MITGLMVSVESHGQMVTNTQLMLSTTTKMHGSIPGTIQLPMTLPCRLITSKFGRMMEFMKKKCSCNDKLIDNI